MNSGKTSLPRFGGSGKKRLAVFCCGALLLTTNALLAAETQASTQYFQVTSTGLEETLNQLSRQAGITLSFDASVVRGKTNAPLQGNYRLADALQQLLSGTGLQAVQLDATTWAIKDNTAGVLLLGPVQVESEVINEEEVFQRGTSVNHISRTQLDRFTATNAGDIFRDTPGVTAANNRTGASLDLNIRGIQGYGRVKILVDGTSSASSDYRGYGGMASHTFVDPELIGGVSIEKGPSAGPYGAGATAGVVNLRTLGADDLISDDKNYGLRLRGTLGNNSYTGSLDGDDGAGNTIPDKNYVFSAAGAWRVTDYLDLTLGYSQRESGNYKVGDRGGENNIFSGTGKPVGQWFTIADTPKGAEVENTSQDATSSLIKANIRLPQNQMLELGFTNYDNAYGNPRLTMTTEGTPSQHRLSETDKETYTAKYAWKPEDNNWFDLRANIWGVRSEEYRAGGTWGSAHEQIAITRSKGIELWNSSSFSWNWLPLLDLRYGGSWLNEKLDMTELGTANVAGVNPDGERTTWSAFIQFEAQLKDWLLLHGGLRRDSYNLTGDKAFGATIPGKADTQVHYDDDDSRINPSFGVVIQPWGEQARFFARYSEGWRPGTIREVINSYDPGSMPDGPIVPEVSKNLEIGTSFSTQELLSASDRANASLTLFNTRYDNYVIGGLGTFSNIDGVRYRGLELSLDYDIDWLFAQYGLTRYLKQQVCGGGTLGCTNGEYYASDIELEGINAPPRYQHSVTLGTRLLEHKLVLGLRVAVVGDRMMPKLDQDGSRNSTAAWTAGWTAYTVYDLFGSYKFNQQLAFNFSVENLRDEYYLEANTPTQLALPAPGRTAKLSVTYNF